MDIKVDAIFLVIAVIISNIGTRYIMIDLHEKHPNLLSHPAMRYIYMFCIAYMGSRDPVLSFGFMLLYGILI